MGKHCQDWFGGSVGQGVDRGWHHPGKLLTNLSDMRVAFGLDVSCRGVRPWSCNCMYADVKAQYPPGSDNKHSMNERIVAGLCGTIILVLGGAPPKVPPAHGPRQHHPSRGPSLSKRDRWRKGFDNSPLQQHRLKPSGVDASVREFLWKRTYASEVTPRCKQCPPPPNHSNQ